MQLTIILENRLNVGQWMTEVYREFMPNGRPQVAIHIFKHQGRATIEFDGDVDVDTMERLQRVTLGHVPVAETQELAEETLRAVGARLEHADPAKWSDSDRRVLLSALLFAT